MFCLSSYCCMCLNKSNLQDFFFKNTNNDFVKQVEIVMPEVIAIVEQLEISVYICLTCQTTLQSFFTFRKKCLTNFDNLKQYLKPKQITRNQKIGVNNNELLITQEQEIENALLPSEEQENKIVEINIKEEFIEPEDNVDEKCYQDFLKCESISNNVKDEIDIIEKMPEKSDASISTNINNDITYFKCLICNKNIASKQKYTRHMKAHESIKIFECFICNKKFAKNNDLIKHIKNHEGIKDFKCSICNKRFVHNSTLKKHMKISHEKINKLECSVCNKKFLLNGTLTRHMKTVHEGIKDFECTICYKKFDDKGKMNRHMKFHLGIKDCECTICKKKFTLNHILQRHMKLHTDIKDFECTICNKKFIQKSNLKTHMNSHAKDLETQDK